MSALADLEPREVFSFFEEISRIPRGSGNIEQISNYLVKFAEERKLEVYQDALKNVIMIKEASEGYEDCEPVILQGHMDMVAVKTPECTLDLKKDGLTLRVDGDELSAEGTSLGGDDGIAVAYALALLDSHEIAHPRLEVVITVDEEVGMEGAQGIDLAMLKGRNLINIDSEQEGIFTVGCAGGARVDLALCGEAQTIAGDKWTVRIGGLKGGHSGVEIHKERGNANQIAGRILRELTLKYPVCLVEIKGGEADNAIARECRLDFLMPKNRAGFGAGAREEIESLLKRLAEEIGEELATRDPGFRMEWEMAGENACRVFTQQDTVRAARILVSLPGGVQAMSPDVPGLVETSLNMGVLNAQAQSQAGLCVSFSVRSSVESAKRALIDKMQAIAELVGAECSVRGDYPGWKYRVDSPLRDKMTTLYRKMYQKDPEVVAIHAGLECGLFMNKLDNLDCVSIGPDMKNIHTTEETLSISSVKRMWEYLKELLAIR